MFSSIFNYLNKSNNQNNVKSNNQNNINTKILSNIQHLKVNSVHTVIFNKPDYISIVDLLENIINMTKYSYKENNCYLSSNLLDNKNIYSYYFKDNNILSEDICNDIRINLMRFTEAHFLILICFEFNEDDINDINLFEGKYIAIFCKSIEKRYIEYVNKDKKYLCSFELNQGNEFSLYLYSKLEDI